jgi:hypothetical protein
MQAHTTLRTEIIVMHILNDVDNLGALLYQTRSKPSLMAFIQLRRSTSATFLVLKVFGSSWSWVACERPGRRFWLRSLTC